jgi:multiple sugar transport system ATP-binding protein
MPAHTVVFGIRPEDIADQLLVAASSPDRKIQARVEVVEPMGAEVYLHLKAGHQPFVARVGTNLLAEVNQSLPFAIPPIRCWCRT